MRKSKRTSTSPKPGKKKVKAVKIKDLPVTKPKKPDALNLGL